MPGRWACVAIVVFWFATMTWLVVAKVLPSVLLGEPPTYRNILRAEADHPSVVGWDVLVNDKSVGWATSQTLRHSDGVRELRGRLHLRRLPLAELAGPWLETLLGARTKNDSESSIHFGLDARNSLVIDPLGHPVEVQSRIAFAQRAPNTDEDLLAGPDFKIILRGIFEGNQLKLTIRYGETVRGTTAWLPNDALVSDALSAQTVLPDLRIGQTWQVPVFSPMRPPNSPVEFLHAVVVREESIATRDGIVPTVLVEYRNDAGSRLTSDQVPRARIWVATDGRVLRQQLPLANGELTLERLNATQTAALDAAPRAKSRRGARSRGLSRAAP